MRIIAGKWRGRTIQAPPGENTRPILDRAKTVLFDVLGNRLAQPGKLPPVAVLDLFSGSGALGLEALSRGARFCLFIEQNRASASTLRKNLDTLRIIREADVIQADASTCQWPTPPADPSAKCRSHTADPGGEANQYELIFMDPPYRCLAGAQPDPLIRNTLRRLATSPVVSPSALIVTRHEYQPSGGPELAPLIEVDRREVGTMTLRLLALDQGTTCAPEPGVPQQGSEGGQDTRPPGGRKATGLPPQAEEAE